MIHEFRMIEDLHKLQNQISNLWDPFVGNGGSAYPALNIRKGADEISITALVPGIQPESLDITVSGNQLRLSGEVGSDLPKEKTGPVRVERFHGKFQRSLELPAEVDPEKTTAEFKNGILTLTLPIRENVKPRKIQIQTK